MRRVLQRLVADAVTHLSQQAGEQAAAENHECRDAVRRCGKRHRSQDAQRGERRNCCGKQQTGTDDAVGRPAAGSAQDDEHRNVDQGHIGGAHQGCREPPREKHLRPADGTHDERLQQPVLGVSAHRRQREERGQHGAEEEDREHGQTVESRTGKLAPADAVRAAEGVHLMERSLAPQGIEHDECDRQQRNDGEHASTQRLTHRPRDKYGDRPHLVDEETHTHAVSPPTASR